jgi:glycerate 2-kinase
MTSNKELVREIFLSALDAVRPAALISKHLTGNELEVTAGGLSFKCEEIDNVYVIGAGKASAAMAFEVEKIIGERITSGHVVVKYGHSVPLSRITVSEAGHPVPDLNGFEATRRIAEIAKKAGAADLVICLLSGGGSSLMADIPAGITGDELIQLNELLVKSGADIEEINTVRKHLSGLKGGRLASLIYPATMISFILSDVPGDLPDVIASGPTCPDPTTFADALGIIRKYDLQIEIPGSIISYLNKGVQGLISESPKPGDPVFNKIHNILTGNNMIALNAAACKAGESSVMRVIIQNDMKGDNSDFCRIVVQKAIACQANLEIQKPVCLLFGGETTIKVSGKGEGGRNQHMALNCAIQIMGRKGITILAAGTDGTDGATDAAGAIVDGDTVANAVKKNISPADHLNRFDSYNFFRSAGDHIKTGPTLTNVMDIVIVLVE